MKQAFNDPFRTDRVVRQETYSIIMSGNFHGKKILVTGAGSGIGYGLAVALEEAGAEVYGLSNVQSQLDELAKAHPKIRTICVDLSDWKATKQELEKLEALDGLVNNAGILKGRMSALEEPEDYIQEMLSVNAVAAVNVTQIVAKNMIKAGKGGSIVNLSSILGKRSIFGFLSYSMSKAALEAMTKHFALELGPHNIRVTAVCPTITKTPMTVPFVNDPETTKNFQNVTPLQRYGEIDDVVGSIMFLLGDSSKMISGSTIKIDGGALSNLKV